MRLLIIPIIAFSLLTSAQTRADSRSMTGEEFLEMNGTYRAGMVHGFLSAATFLGLSETEEEIYQAGLECMKSRGLRSSTDQVANEFSRYLEAHPDDAKQPFARAFLLFMIDCPK